jgi:hypothetical protein
MSKTSKLTCALVLTFVLAVPVLAEEAVQADKPAYGATISALSAYVSRGTVYTDDPVLQAEGWVAYEGFKLASWNNVDLTNDRVAERRLSETDWTLSYTLPIKAPAISVGYIYYTFPNLHIGDTQEVFASATFNVLLSPTIAVYYDIDQVNGAYANASVAYSVPLVKDSVNADLGASVGYGDSSYISGCFADAGASLVDFVLSCKVPLKVSERVSITPQISYMTVIDNDLRECTEYSEALYGGVALTVNF